MTTLANRGGITGNYGRKEGEKKKKTGIFRNARENTAKRYAFCELFRGKKGRTGRREEGKIRGKKERTALTVLVFRKEGRQKQAFYWRYLGGPYHARIDGRETGRNAGNRLTPEGGKKGGNS